MARTLSLRKTWGNWGQRCGSLGPPWQGWNPDTGLSDSVLMECFLRETEHREIWSEWKMIYIPMYLKSGGFPGSASGKEPTCQCRKCKRGWFNPRWERSPGGWHGNPLQYSCLEIPWTEEPGGLQSLGSQRVPLDWSDLAGTYLKTRGLAVFTDSVFIHLFILSPFLFLSQSWKSSLYLWRHKAILGWSPYTFPPLGPLLPAAACSPEESLMQDAVPVSVALGPLLC